MKLSPRVNPVIARGLLEYPDLTAYFGELIDGYGEQLLSMMMTVPDDQMPGFRGMLLALDNLRAAVHRDALLQVIEKARND